MVQKLEEAQASMQQVITTLQMSSSAQDSLHHNLVSQLDDLENRNRRNIIRLRGVPEMVRSQDLIPSLTKLFSSLLGKAPDAPIEFDYAHGALWPQSPDPIQPRDIICRVHLHSLKEEIMHKSRLSIDLTVAGSKVSLFLDLLRHTLRLHQTSSTPYRWGFPFALHACHQDASATLRSPSDLQLFLKTLNLTDVTLPDWDSAFFNVLPSTDIADPDPSKKRPLAMPPRQHLDSSPNKDVTTWEALTHTIDEDMWDTPKSVKFPTWAYIGLITSLISNKSIKVHCYTLSPLIINS